MTEILKEDQLRVFDELSMAVRQAFPKIVFSKDADWPLVLRLSSPGGDPSLGLTVWVDEIATPSIAFGPSHTHCSADSTGYLEIVELLRKIFADDWVAAFYAGGKYPDYGRWLDLSKSETLADELTDAYAPKYIEIKSWTGGRDGRYDIDSLGV